MCTEMEEQVTAVTKRAIEKEREEGFDQVIKAFKELDPFLRGDARTKALLRLGYEKGVISGVVIGTLQERYGVSS